MSDLKSTLESLLHSLTFSNFEVNLDSTSDALLITLTLSPEDSGILIGYHGEKIDALQLILNLIHNLERTEYQPVRLDINGYRDRRSKSVQDLADKAVAQALGSGREIILPPLSPSERRLIHVYLADRSDVSTYSEGEGFNRRLIVRPSTLMPDTSLSEN